MEAEIDLDTGPLIPAKKVAARYDVDPKTLDRWRNNESLDFPKPVTINNRHYFREKRLETWEKKRAAGSAA